MVALHHRGIAAVVIGLHVSNCRLHEHQAARRRLWYALHADGPTPIPHPNRATPAPAGTTHPRALALAWLSASSLRYTSAPDTNAGRRRVLSEPRRPTEPAPHRSSGPEPRRSSRGKPSQDNRGTGDPDQPRRSVRSEPVRQTTTRPHRVRQGSAREDPNSLTRSGMGSTRKLATGKAGS